MFRQFSMETKQQYTKIYNKLIKVHKYKTNKIYESYMTLINIL